MKGEEMQDFVIESDSPDVIQKHLRQWRHEYTIKIIHYSIVEIQNSVTQVHIVIERTKKGS